MGVTDVQRPRLPIIAAIAADTAMAGQPNLPGAP